MEDKITKDMVSQLKRIADALEKKNSLTESDQKRRLKLEKLQEKNLKADLREKLKWIGKVRKRLNEKLNV